MFGGGGICLIRERPNAEIGIMRNQRIGGRFMYLGESNLAQTCQNEGRQKLIHVIGLDIIYKDMKSQNLKIGNLLIYF